MFNYDPVMPLLREISNNWLAPFDGGKLGCPGSSKWRQAEEQRYRSKVRQVLSSSDYLKSGARRGVVSPDI